MGIIFLVNFTKAAHSQGDAALWTDGYFSNTVDKKGNDTAIQKYIQGQGKESEYGRLH